jgi:hypothetical protein
MALARAFIAVELGREAEAKTAERRAHALGG